jgi:hypothetical protein
MSAAKAGHFMSRGGRPLCPHPFLGKIMPHPFYYDIYLQGFCLESKIIG